MNVPNLGELQGVLIGAASCLNCRDPLCVSMCRQHVDVPAAMRLIIGRPAAARASAWIQEPEEATASAIQAIEASFEAL